MACGWFGLAFCFRVGREFWVVVARFWWFALLDGLVSSCF